MSKDLTVSRYSPDQLMCLGIGVEDTHTLSDTQGEKKHTGGKPHILTIIVTLHSGAMWALGLVVLLVTVAGVLALLVYVLKW